MGNKVNWQFEYFYLLGQWENDDGKMMVYQILPVDEIDKLHHVVQQMSERQAVLEEFIEVEHGMHA